MEGSETAKTRRSGFANILKNLAWLLGGKGFAAVCSLAYLAILARSLELKDFGHFSLIFATGQLLCALATFETWQTMVRFGAEPVQRKDWKRFGELGWLCGSIDVMGAIVGCILAGVIYYGFGSLLDLNPEYVDMAFAFNCAMLWSRMTTPTGIVRVLDRFDVGTYVEAVMPAGRLLASLVIVLVGATVGRFLFAWAFFDLLVGALYWIMARRLAPEALRWSNFRNPFKALREERALRRFFGITYGSSSLDALTRQGPLLAVGYFLGTSAAGLYRLADQLALGVARVANMITRAALPEFVMARTSVEIGEFRKLVRQVTILASLGGVLVAVLALTLGDWIMLLMGGEEFLKAADILVPVAIGASLGLAGVAFEPLLFSTGHAQYPFIIRAVGAVALGTAILLFHEAGPVAIGWMVAVWAAAVSLAMGITVRLVLQSMAAAKQAK
ncbi:lipopolysaccharide biosynthesis protein [Qipengyuania aurantiaca]|uniref:Lipopolysaccharide biosynthesis protein n=1 Tax=Qipengyuania aurantiaca TaxID=2867233 RepID=A0ABX8ZR66_9SPHN|nr:lipopolysaccharide biosynthesis protein [Qipengyuania aurantiaca]QZD89673.1 lipopolysaccharide biosynthesis protein [Qipengyuania aurantiaca]